MNTSLDTNRSDDPMLFSSRPLLVFKHNPKAGGGSIRLLLNEIKNQTFTFRCLSDCTLYNNNAPCANSNHCNKNKKQSLSQLKKRNDTAVVVDEFDFLSEKVQKDAYVISSIREPCDHYVSLWSYGSHHAGGMYDDFHQRYPKWTEKAYGKDPPWFDSEQDIHAFQYVWLRDSKVQGSIANRHRLSYGHQSTLQEYPVDCWVYVDNYQATLYSCLRQYEAQGGTVNWTTPLMTELVETLQEELYLTRRVLKTYHTKNDPIENPQQYHHSKCSKYFDNETADMVRFGHESFIYDIFGYDGCCQGRTPKNSLILPPPPPEWNSTVSVSGNAQSLENVVLDRKVFNSHYIFFGGVVLSLLFLMYALIYRKWSQKNGEMYSPVQLESELEEENDEP